MVSHAMTLVSLTRIGCNTTDERVNTLCNASFRIL